MYILITGGTGFVGSHVVHALVKENRKIILLKHSYSNTTRIDSLLDKIVSYDIDKVPLEDIFQKHSIEAVIHLATKYGRKTTRFIEVFEANLFFPLNLIQLSIQHNVKVFINTDTFYNKPDLIGYNNLFNYSLSKNQLIQCIGMLFSNHVYDLKVINMRLEHVFGQMDNPDKFISMIIQKIKDGVPSIPLTSGKQKRDFVFIDDVVSAYQTVLNNYGSITEDYYEFEVGMGQSHEIRSIVELIKETAGNKKTDLNFGAIPLQEKEIMDSKADIKALKKLGWSPQFDLKTGFKQLINEK